MGQAGVNALRVVDAGPGHEHGRANAPFACKKLEAVQRAGRCAGPAGALNAVSAWAAESVNVLAVLSFEPQLCQVIVGAFRPVV